MFHNSQIVCNTLWTSLFSKLSIFLSFYMSLHEYMPHVFRCLQRPVQGVRLPETGLTGKQPNLGAEKGTQFP